MVVVAVSTTRVLGIVVERAATQHTAVLRIDPRNASINTLAIALDMTRFQRLAFNQPPNKRPISVTSCAA
jgi:hypothetical protein